MGIEGFGIYSVSPWALSKLEQSCYLWNAFLGAKYISKHEDWNEIQRYFRKSKVLEVESKEDILHILIEGRTSEVFLELGWGLLHFYLSASWDAYNNEWQHENRFKDSVDRPPIVSYHSDNNLLMLDVFTTTTYTSHDRYVAYYTSDEVRQIHNLLKQVLGEDFESRLDRIEQLGKEVTIYRNNQDYYFERYFDKFSDFYTDAAKGKRAVILQAIC